METTVNKALLIQRAQMVWYRQSIGRAGIRAIRAQTSLPNVNPDVPISVFDINSCIPRGGCFESHIKKFNRTDPTTMAWHNAIRRGLQ